MLRETSVSVNKKGTFTNQNKSTSNKNASFSNQKVDKKCLNDIYEEFLASGEENDNLVDKKVYKVILSETAQSQEVSELSHQID